VAFGLAVTLLAVSVPALGFAGSRAILHSRSGQLEDERNNPSAPGYAALVDPTPTALLVQRSPSGEPEALTLLALGHQDSGGSVLFIPLDTVLVHPAIFIDRLRTAYAKAGYHSFVTQVGKLLNEGFGSVIDVTDAQWSKLVAPVAPLAIVNPYPVIVGSVTFPAGPLSLAADQVAPYLNALAPGHDDLDRMARHRLVWQAWLKAVAASHAAETVPAVPAGLAPFIETLAAGSAQLATLAVTPSATVAPDGASTFQVDPHAMNTQLTDAIPSPVSPGLGDRFSVRVLNGASGTAIPGGVTQRLVFVGAQLNAIGNAARFGQKVTRIEYHDPNRLKTAQAVKYVLGGDISYNPTSTDTVDIVVTLGQQTIDRVAADPGGGGGAGG